MKTCYNSWRRSPLVRSIGRWFSERITAGAPTWMAKLGSGLCGRTGREGSTGSLSPICDTKVAEERVRLASSTIVTVALFYVFTGRQADDFSWYARQDTQDETEQEETYLIVRFAQRMHRSSHAGLGKAEIRPLFTEDCLRSFMHGGLRMRTEQEYASSTWLTLLNVLYHTQDAWACPAGCSWSGAREMLTANGWDTGWTSAIKPI